MQALGIAGAVISAAGSVMGGMAANENAKAEAQMMERRGNEERAASTRDQATKAKQTQLLLSRQQALAASSGAGATDPTILDLMSKTQGQGFLQSQTIGYEGQVAQEGLQYQAAVKRYQGKQQMMAGFIGAGTSILGGANSWLKYSSGGNKPSSGFSAPQFGTYGF